MKIYVAAPWDYRETARQAGQTLSEAGFRVVSTWWYREDQGSQHYGPDAAADLDELQKADVLIVLNLCISEGKAVELGYALAQKKMVIVVGERSRVNIFHYLPQVVNTGTLDDALAVLACVMSVGVKP